MRTPMMAISTLANQPRAGRWANIASSFMSTTSLQRRRNSLSKRRSRRKTLTKRNLRKVRGWELETTSQRLALACDAGHYNGIPRGISAVELFRPEFLIAVEIICLRNEWRPRGWLYELESTRDGRADEDEKHVAETQLAVQGRMGRATGVADTLCCLELDVARYQDRIARSAAYFLCGYPFSRRNHRPFCRIRRAGGLVTAARVRLPAPGFYWRFDVCRKLRPPFLGRAARFIRSGSGVAGDHPDLRHALSASNASRRTIATTQTSRCTPRARRRGNDLRASSRF